jgi:hypothetical protein
MKSLRQQLEEHIEVRNIMEYDPRDIIERERYEMPDEYSFITLEEFCELNGLIEEELTDNQINYFYEHYGERSRLPMCRYHIDNDHNDWIIENLQSHNYKIVINRLKNLLKNKITNIDTSLSEKRKNARIVKIYLDKDCDIFNKDSQETFTLNDSELSNEINDILKFHNYYITLIYFYAYSNVLILEPIQTENATDVVKQYNYVYHITHKDNIQSILKKGLRPKVKKSNEDDRYRYYTDRIFLILNTDDVKKDVKRVINDLNLLRDYAILKIDISKLNITYWWDDASKGNTVYTVESIHPKFIEVIDNINDI